MLNVCLESRLGPACSHGTVIDPRLGSGVFRMVGTSSESSSTRDDGPPRRVLVVDDDAGFRLVIKSYLEARGYQIVGESNNGAAAVADAFRLHPDAITLNHNMPHLGGEMAFEHIQAIRPDSKVVVISGTVSEAPEWADVFLTKDRIDELPDLLDGLFE
jgi:CheY-like chemotaxis protein